MEKVCILGLGYIGLPTAAMFATHGKKVVGVDVNQTIIDTLNNGDIHIQEPGLKKLVRESLNSGNLQVSGKPELADVFIIAVPTPFQDEMGKAQVDGDEIEYKKADMSYVIAATESILPYLQPGDLVILESTSPPKTTIDLVKPILERNGLEAGEDFYLAYSPERVLPGKILQELVENSRVIGGIDQKSAELGKELYSAFVQGEIVLTDATTAEMVKLMENTYRDVNIALANEFSRLAERMDVDVWESIEIANLHPRVDILRPGTGVGGHCISVDPWFLVEKAPDLTPLIHMARQVNDAQPEFVVDLVRRAIGDLNGKKIAALGLAYKPNVDDLRESPAIEVVYLLQEEGAEVWAYEPFKPEAKIPGVTTVPTLEDAIAEAEVLLLLVAHRRFLFLDTQEVADITPARLAVDAVHGWPSKAWEEAGFRLTRLGPGT